MKHRQSFMLASGLCRLWLAAVSGRFRDHSGPEEAPAGERCSSSG